MNADVADRSKLKEPDEVVAATKAALFEPRPKRRYMVVPDGESAEITIRAQLEKLVQVNEGQPYTYNRAALIKMLDEALVRGEAHAATHRGTRDAKPALRRADSRLNR